MDKDKDMDNPCISIQMGNSGGPTRAVTLQEGLPSPSKHSPLLDLPGSPGQDWNCDFGQTLQAFPGSVRIQPVPKTRLQGDRLQSHHSQHPWHGSFLCCSPWSSALFSKPLGEETFPPMSHLLPASIRNF